MLTDPRSGSGLELVVSALESGAEEEVGPWFSVGSVCAIWGKGREREARGWSWSKMETMEKMDDGEGG